MRRVALGVIVAALWVGRAGAAEPSSFKEDMWGELVRAVPGVMKSQDAKTGRFGTGIWTVNDQHAIWSLAVAWGEKQEGNPYYHNPEVLEAVMKGGDALIDDMDASGQWTFRKKDGSTWGQIYMPWTYSRWIRALGIVKDAMPRERRERWEKAITLGVEGMIKTELVKPIQNIPATDAAAIYHAGQIFGREDWKKAGQEYVRKTAAAQDPGGFWVEHVGPVINYNFVYVDAIGFYYAKSGDKSVLPALERAAGYHAHFTYPDGRMVETVDERNAYELGRGMGGVGFTFSAEGRGFVAHQWELMKKDKQPVTADAAASVVAYGEDGPAAPVGGGDGKFVLGKNDAMTFRQGPWFGCVSAYTAEIGPTRWIQDRQNFVSLYHEKVGLILGGGNTKLQPLWSTFAAGDVSLLKHKEGDENPSFAEPTGLVHVPDRAELDVEGHGVALWYGGARCKVSVKSEGDNRAVVRYALEGESALPVEAHATLIPDEKLASGWKTAGGKSGTLGEPFDLSARETGGWFEHNGWRVGVPDGARVVWPAKMHNQYAKDGKSELFQARIVVVMPLGTMPAERRIVVEVR